MLLLFATACSGGIDTDKAKADAQDFLTLVENKNYTGAATYLHPDHVSDLTAYFARVEERERVDFSAEIEIKFVENDRGYGVYNIEIDIED